MENLINNLFLVVSLLILFLIIVIPLMMEYGEKWLFYKDKCEVCGKKNADVLSQGKNRWFLCRIHLMEKYTEIFLKNHFNVVAVEFLSDPRLLRFKHGMGFYYYLVSDPIFKDYFMEGPEKLKQLLGSIDSRKCEKCDSKAKVLFISKENAGWKEIKYNFVTNDQGPYYFIAPSEDYLKKGHYFCNKHAVEEMTVSLKNYPKSIIRDGGVWLPFDDNGFLVPA